MTKTGKKLVSRVRDMERRYDEVSQALAALDEAVSAFNACKDDIDILREYMDSGQWLKDFKADEAGMIPAEIKRGVLSEDALYDLLQEADKIQEIVREVICE